MQKVITLKLVTCILKKNNKIKKSYGMAVCRFNKYTEQYEVLLVRKRCTYSFVDFVLGHYNKKNDHRLKQLFNGMTNDEKITILSNDYGQIYYKVFLINPDSIRFNDPNFTSDDLIRYKFYKQRFENSFLDDSGQRLRRLIDQSRNVTEIWEIPKGRKSYSQERELNCAIRECREESGIELSEYEVMLDISPSRIVKTDTHVRYENFYYIGVLHGNSRFRPHIHFRDNQQISEVVDIQWMSLDQIKIIDIEKNLHSIMQIIFKLLKKKKHVGKLSKLGLI